MTSQLRYFNELRQFSVLQSSPATVMVPFPNQVVGPTSGWAVFDPYGNPVSTSGTTTSGLQEAINFAVFNGYPLEIYGQGVTTVSRQTGTLNSSTTITGLTDTTALSTALVNGQIFVTGLGIPSFTTITTVDSLTQIHISNAATSTGPASLRFAQNLVFLNCSSGIQVPPAEQWNCTIKGTNITFNTNVTGPCFQFDSCLIVNFQLLGGQIVGQPAGPNANTSFLVYFNPTNPTPADGLTTISGCKFFINNLAYPASGGLALASVACNVSNGSIVNNFFGSCELNGTGTGVSPNTKNGFYVFGPSASTAFEENIIELADVHLFTAAGVQVGVVTSTATSLARNTWRIGGIRSVLVGFSTYGSADIIDIGAVTNEEGGTVAQGVAFQTSATVNQGRFGALVATTPVLNQAGNKNIYTYNGDIFKDGTAYTNP